MIMAILTKEDIELGLAYNSEGQSIIILVGHDSVQAEMVLEKKLRILHL